MGNKNAKPKPKSSSSRSKPKSEPKKKPKPNKKSSFTRALFKSPPLNLVGHGRLPRTQASKLVYGYMHEIMAAVSITAAAVNNNYFNNHLNRHSHSHSRSASTLSRDAMKSASLSLLNYIPKGIMDLCLTYYHLNLFELGYENTESWDAWDPLVMHSFMFTEPAASADAPAGAVMCRGNGGYNPYSFGTRVVASGITIWKFKLVVPTVYWIGIYDAANCVKQSENIHSCTHFYSIDVDGGEINYTKNDGKRVRTPNAALKFGGNAAHVACLCLEYNAMGDKATLSFSNNGADYIKITDTIDLGHEYRLCISQSKGAKIELVSSVHLDFHDRDKHDDTVVEADVEVDDKLADTMALIQQLQEEDLRRLDEANNDPSTRDHSHSKPNAAAVNTNSVDIAAETTEAVANTDNTSVIASSAVAALAAPVAVAAVDEPMNNGNINILDMDMNIAVNENENENKNENKETSAVDIVDADAKEAVVRAPMDHENRHGSQHNSVDLNNNNNSGLTLTVHERRFKEYFYANMKCGSSKKDVYYTALVALAFNDLELLMNLELEDTKNRTENEDMFINDCGMHKIHCRFFLKIMHDLKQENSAFQQWFREQHAMAHYNRQMKQHALYTFEMLSLSLSLQSHAHAQSQSEREHFIELIGAQHRNDAIAMWNALPQNVNADHDHQNMNMNNHNIENDNDNNNNGEREEVGEHVGEGEGEGEETVFVN